MDHHVAPPHRPRARHAVRGIQDGRGGLHAAASEVRLYVGELLVGVRPDAFTEEREHVAGGHGEIVEACIAVLRQHPRLDRRAGVIAHRLHREPRHAKHVQPGRDGYRLAPDRASHVVRQVRLLHAPAVRDHLVVRGRHHIHLHRRLVRDVIDGGEPLVRLVRPVIREERAVAGPGRRDVQAVGGNAVVGDGELDHLARRGRMVECDGEMVVGVRENERPVLPSDRANPHAAALPRGGHVGEIERDGPEIRGEQAHAHRRHANDAVRGIGECQREAIVLDVERLARIRIGGYHGRVEREGKCREWDDHGCRICGWAPALPLTRRRAR